MHVEDRNKSIKMCASSWSLAKETNKLLQNFGHQSPRVTAHNSREIGVGLYLLCNKFMCKVTGLGSSCPATIFEPIDRNLCVTLIMAISLKA